MTPKTIPWEWIPRHKGRVITFAIFILVTISLIRIIREPKRIAILAPSTSDTGEGEKNGTMAVSGWRSIPFDRKSEIPYKLWQTWKNCELPPEAISLREKWESVNAKQPLHSTLFNDSEMLSFMEQHFDAEVVHMYNDLPLGVMRADLWRLAIIYIKGGIYADIDVAPLRPVSQWLPIDPMEKVGQEYFPPSITFQYSKVSWSTCSLLLALEHPVNVCQWALAATAGHPVLKVAMELMLERFYDGLDLTPKDYYVGRIHDADQRKDAGHSEFDWLIYHSGPALLTDALKRSLLLPVTMNAQDIFAAVWSDVLVNKRAEKMGLCLMGSEFYHGWALDHLYGSQTFERVAGWESWADRAGEMYTTLP